MPMFKRKRDRKAKTPSRWSKKQKKNTFKKEFQIRGTNPQNAVVFRGIGFPDRLTTNLVYAESIVLDPSALTIMPFVTYNLASLFDPQVALGGGQPTYFDQLSLVYQRYIVNGAKITVTFSRGTTTTTSVGPYLCGIQTSDAIGLPTTSPGALISSPNCVSRFVTVEDGSQSVVQTYSRRQTYPNDDSSLQARINANPTINWYAKVFAGPQSLDVEVPINAMVVIEYNCTFSTVTQVTDA